MLIFKASGVFNFAQGAMVLFAALSVARMSEGDAAARRIRLSDWRDGHFCVADRAIGVAASGQPGRGGLLMATLGVSFFLDGFGQTVWGSDIYQIDTGLPKTPVLVAENIFQGGILINTEDLVAAAAAALLVIALALFFQRRRQGARCVRWRTIIRPRSRSAFH